MLFKPPSGWAVAMLATSVIGGLGVSYLPVTISETPVFEDTWQAEWGPEIANFGLAVVAFATMLFLATHIKWPQWFIGLGKLRIKLYKKPYGPDVFLLDAQLNLVGFFKVTKRTVALKPYGWDERDPFIRITYHIFNGSQFTVLFGDPHGNLSVGKSTLHEKPTLYEGAGWWPSQATAYLQINQRMKLEFWNELAESTAPGSAIELLIGSFDVSLSAGFPGMKATRISLASDTPFFAEMPR